MRAERVAGARVSQRRPVSMPERVGRYEVLLPIASGGMATVYLARGAGAGGFERDVAIKVTHPHLLEAEHLATDIVEEAKLASRIRHPNVVPVLDVGEDASGLYLVMELVDGDSLSGLLRLAKKQGVELSLGVLFRVLCDALEGLHAAHELTGEQGEPLGLVHRDFSPHNVLVGRDGIARLTDFGVAKAASRLGQTATGLVKGKLRYMAPEQARNDKALDRRCDVWAAGIVAWELATRRRLYGDETNEMTILLELVSKAPPRVTELSPELPEALADAIAWALTIAVDERCPSARELAERLAAAVPGGLASVGEASEAVRRLTEPSFQQRRAKIAELRALRASMGRIATSVTKEDTGSSQVARVPVEPPSAVSAPGVGASESGAVTERREATQVTTVSSVELDAPSPTPRRGRFVLVAALALVLGGGGALVALRGAGSSPAGASSPSSASASSAQREGPSSAASTGASAATSSAVSAAEQPSPTVALTANAPFVRVSVGGRSVSPKSPTATFTLELSAAEAGQTLEIVAFHQDGRSASAKLAPSQGSLSLSFAPSAAKAAPPRAPSLAKNPYGP